MVIIHDGSINDYYDIELRSSMHGDLPILDDYSKSDDDEVVYFTSIIVLYDNKL